MTFHSGLFAARSSSGGPKALMTWRRSLISSSLFEHAIQTVCIDDGEGRFIKPINRDRAVPRNVVLQQRQESAFAWPSTCGCLRANSLNLLLHGLRVHADDRADRILKRLGSRAKNSLEHVAARVWALRQDERHQRLQIGIR